MKNYLFITILRYILPVAFIFFWIFIADYVGNRNIVPYPDKVLDNFINFSASHIGLGSLTINIPQRLF